MTADDTTPSLADTTTSDTAVGAARRPRRRAASRPAGPPEPSTPPPAAQPQPALALSETTQTADDPPSVATPQTAAGATPEVGGDAGSSPPAAKKATRRRSTTAKAAAGASPPAESVGRSGLGSQETHTASTSDVEPPPAKKASNRRSKRGVAADPFVETAVDAGTEADTDPSVASASTTLPTSAPAAAAPFSPIFQAPDPVVTATSTPVEAAPGPMGEPADEPTAGAEDVAVTADDSATPSTRRRRSRGGRNRRRSSDGSGAETSPREPSGEADASPTADLGQDDAAGAAESEPRGADGSAPAAAGTSTPSTSSRRRRRRRSGDAASEADGDAPDVAVKVREPRPASQSITSVEGSTRIEAKKQRRREGREAGRRRVPILSESEFLARRESVERVMAIRQRSDVTQVAVLEDDVLVEHYVASEEQSSLLGNVYLGRVQNVLPSMEAAFIDIGKGRNAVLYAGEVNWDLVGGHQARRIENALKPGQQILVQVSKDPVGHKGARLTSQISLPGRYLVYVPGGGSSGISRKLPDTERNRLKSLLKEILPDESGVIVRTAAEGASEEELRRDATRLMERWDEIEKLTKSGKSATLLYAEPDTMLKVVRDLFTEDFAKLVISGDDAWDVVNDYVGYVAPDLVDRMERYDGEGDIFVTYRVDEQIAKALERKVWLPSGGSLVIDRTEAMTVVDVNTGKFTGSGGNLEQTVTKNNLEAAEEIVRQLRLRDIGGIIVIDFIDMVLESNRDLVLRRLVECLGRDRTRHQVAEVTSLGLVQMTRKRIGTGLVEAFSVPCGTCHGRGVVIESEPVTGRSDDSAHQQPSQGSSSGGRGRRGGRSTAAAEQTSSTAAERHGAAAATAAIAAALHPELKAAVVETLTEAEPSDPAQEESAQEAAAEESQGSAEPGSAEPEALTTKSATRKSTAKKASAKKTTSKQAAPRKATAKKASSKKASTERKAPARKRTPKSAAPSDAAASATQEAVGAPS